MAIEPGTELLHYRLVDKIGEGGMGAAWRAVDSSRDREVAIEMLPEAIAGIEISAGRCCSNWT
jgi:serine/threonine-protein kinase